MCTVVITVIVLQSSLLSCCSRHCLHSYPRLLSPQNAFPSTRTHELESERQCMSSCEATHCNTLQHTATHCNTLQHTATHCNSERQCMSSCEATHCNTLQHTATHCNTLQQREPKCLYHTPACLRRLERLLAYIVGTGKINRAKERLDV